MAYGFCGSFSFVGELQARDVLVGGSYCDKEEPAAFHGTSNAAVLSGAGESARNPPFSGGPFDAARAFG